MLTIDLSKRAAKFLKSLPAKQGKQIAQTLMGLRKLPFPHDSKKLTGCQYYRVDIGEYRIIYRVDNCIIVLLIGKRNDDEVYRKLNRLTK